VARRRTRRPFADFARVGHRNHGLAREDEPDVFDLAKPLTACGADVL
jgi:hypothetical protein